MNTKTPDQILQQQTFENKRPRRRKAQCYLTLIENSLYNTHQLILHEDGYAITTVYGVPHVRSKSLKRLYELYQAYLAGMHHGIRLIRGKNTEDFLYKNPKRATWTT